MAISASDANRINRALTVTADRYAPKISNEIARNDGVIAVFGLRGGIKVVTGGLRAIETLDTSENTNFGFRPYTQNIPTTKQDTRREAKYTWATINGAVTVPDVEVAMNAGPYVIHKFIAAELTNAKRTLIRLVAAALRAATPGTNDPESIPTLCPATAFGSQTGNFGELSRSSYSTWWNSQYDSTSMDMSAITGFESLVAFMLQSCAKGTSKLDAPNFGLCTGTIFAAIASHGEALRRMNPDDKLYKMGFTNIDVNGATIIADPSITSTYLYLLNTNFCNIQVLRRKTMQNIGDRPQSLPIHVREFMTPYNSEQSVGIMSVQFALTCSSLQRQGLAGAVS